MEFRFDQVLMKPTDFKVCEKCGRINWYENESCISCGGFDFDGRLETVEKAIGAEYGFYVDTEGYSEEEVDAMTFDA